MGATLEQAKAAMAFIGSEKATKTHPGKLARLTAMTNGWIEARDLTLPPTSNEKPDTKPIQQPEIKPKQASNSQPISPAQQTIFYVSRCVFPNDPNAYFITNTNLIVTINTFGQVVVIGQKKTNLSGFCVDVYDLVCYL